jgi:serine/threonine protein kinase
MWKHVQERPEPPSRLNPAIPSAIDQVVLKALEKNPKRRFQSARALQQAYQSALTPQESIWQHLDTSIRQLKSTTKQPLNQLLQPGMIPAYLVSLTQHHTMSAVDIQNMPTCARGVANIKQQLTTKVHPAALIELSIILLLTLALSILSLSIFSSHPTPTQQTNQSTIQHQIKIPMKISILINLPPPQHRLTTRSVNSLPPLKPSLMLRDQYTDQYQTQSNDTNQYSNNNNNGGYGQGYGNGSKSNHGHGHGKHGDD